MDCTQSIIRILRIRALVKAIALTPAPYHLAYFESTHKLYISSRKLAVIWVLDPYSLKIIKEIDIGNGVAHQMVVRGNE